MKKYERPFILENDELAEGIYANSGTNNVTDDPVCWTVSVNKEQVVAHEKYANFRVSANHPGTVKHISTESTVTIVFNMPITDAVFESFSASVSGCTAVLVRQQHGNAYNSADQYSSLLKVTCDDPDGLQVVSATIACTHAINVQGEYD